MTTGKTAKSRLKNTTAKANCRAEPVTDNKDLVFRKGFYDFILLHEDAHNSDNHSIAKTGNEGVNNIDRINIEEI